MTLNLAQARRYVVAHGTPIEQARLAALEGNAVEPPASLLAAQQPSGGFAYEWMADAPPSLNHTALALGWLRDMGHGDGDMSAKGVAFLIAAQGKRGIWRESAELLRYDLPLWMDPDATAADVYTTALCSSALVPYPEASLVVDRAVAWLQTQQGRDGLLQGFKLHASALAVPAFTEILGGDARATRRLVSGLGDALDKQWAAATVVLLLRRMLDAGYGLRTGVVARAWSMLPTLQLADGSFADEEEDTGSSAVTLDVLYLAHQLGYEITKP
jgi:hypothetical protein